MSPQLFLGFFLPPWFQEDSSDLKCQLHFAKEESALMCKKLTKLVKDSEAMKEELAKYRSLHGDINAPLTVEEVRAGAPRTVPGLPFEEMLSRHLFRFDYLHKSDIYWLKNRSTVEWRLSQFNPPFT